MSNSQAIASIDSGKVAAAVAMGSDGSLPRPGQRFQPVIALGKGGMAEVLLCVARGPSGFNKLVVLKTIRPELATDDELRAMFLAEARLSARLNHPNVVQVYEVVEGALPCIVMEYLDGAPMSALYAAARDRFSLPLQLSVLSEVLEGLHYSHELQDYDGTPLNIVHRDVSPQNVFLTFEGEVKVLDFGIAKASNTCEQTQTGVIKGKICYMPPEQLCGGVVDRRADVFAVGCMLWQAAAGVKLWATTSENDVMRALLNGAIPKPSTVRPVDAALEAIVMRALAADASDRYATAQELRIAIDDYLADNFPRNNRGELGALVNDVFAAQREQRKSQIHLAITKPFSEPPPPIPAGLEGLVANTGITEQSLRIAQRRQLLLTGGIVLGATLLALGGMVALISWKSESAGDAHRTAAIATVVAPAEVRIRLSANPPEATFSIDGTPVSGNPALLTVPPDARDHEIRVVAAGYEQHTRTLRFENDLSIQVALQPISPPPIASSAKIEAAPVAAKPGRYTGKPQRAPEEVAKPKAASNCDPPYYFDNGIKVYKTGCF